MALLAIAAATATATAADTAIARSAWTAPQANGATVADAIQPKHRGSGRCNQLKTCTSL